EIDNLIYEVFEMMNCFKHSFINENKELILDRESNIFFSLKDCANKLDLVVKFIHWVSRCVPTKAFYILNDDLTMTLIWKDGELLV
ncbi:hypothetical protein Q0N05_10640, partial [Staphylococcus aureus]|nr:hypothetical protein [Staphylococcus aureus]